MPHHRACSTARRFAAGNWGTISNVFFLAVGFWTDLLHIRVMLVIGYGALFMEVCLADGTGGDRLPTGDIMTEVCLRDRST